MPTDNFILFLIGTPFLVFWLSSLIQAIAGRYNAMWATIFSSSLKPCNCGLPAKEPDEPWYREGHLWEYHKTNYPKIFNPISIPRRLSNVMRGNKHNNGILELSFIVNVHIIVESFS